MNLRSERMGGLQPKKEPKKTKKPSPKFEICGSVRFFWVPPPSPIVSRCNRGVGVADDMMLFRKINAIFLSWVDDSRRCAKVMLCNRPVKYFGRTGEMTIGTPLTRNIGSRVSIFYGKEKGSVIAQGGHCAVCTSYTK